MSKTTTYTKTYGPLESIDAQIESNKPVEKYAVCIIKSRNVVGHLKKGANGRFAKTIFFFLKGGPYSKAKKNNIWAQM